MPEFRVTHHFKCVTTKRGAIYSRGCESKPGEETMTKARQLRGLVRDNKLKQRSVFNQYQWNSTDPHSHANMEHSRHVQTRRSPFYTVD